VFNKKVEAKCAQEQEVVAQEARVEECVVFFVFVRGSKGGKLVVSVIDVKPRAGKAINSLNIF
jgi:hypothetical protein